MASINDDREKQIEDLDNFIESTSKQLAEITSSLGWTIDGIMASENRRLVCCPFDERHRVSEDNVAHFQKCEWQAEGYGPDDIPLSEPSSLLASSYIKFDEQLQDEVLFQARSKDPTMRTGSSARLIARTSDRLTANYTSDEKAAIYDYVIANTAKSDIGDDIADMNNLAKKNADHPKVSLLELLAQERNLKRRRAKHRGVHTNKKSHIEILREVVQQQMEMYEEYLVDIGVKVEPSTACQSTTSSANHDERVIEEKPTNRRVGDEEYNFRKARDISLKSSQHDRADSRSRDSTYSKRKHSSDRHANGRRFESPENDGARKGYDKRGNDPVKRDPDASRERREPRRESTRGSYGNESRGERHRSSNQDRSRKEHGSRDRHRSDKRHRSRERRRSSERRHKYSANSTKNGNSDEDYHRDRRRNERH